MNMHLPRFEYLRAATAQEAAALLKECGPGALLVAGGTDLFPRMKYRLIRPETVISLRKVHVDPPAVTRNNALGLDAFMSLADLCGSPLVKKTVPILAEAALSVGSNQIRHMGTLGGNLCQESRCSYYNQSHTFQFVEPCFKREGDLCYAIPKGKKCIAVFCSDTAPALISLGALITITGPGESRRMPLEELYTGDSLKPLAISNTEIVTDILVPGTDSARGTAFAKFSMRRGIEFAGLNVAVVLDMEEDKVCCRDARITVGAISSSPLRMVDAEDAMRGKDLSKELFEEAAEMAASKARPLMHHGYSVPYLRECLKVTVRRAFETALQRLREGCIC
jgi:4-hydroxybenzoyl-CoA reductase beta subunit